MPNEPRELLSSSTAARALGVSTTSVKRWADGGLLPCVRTAGKHRRFARATVEQFRSALVGLPADAPAREGRDPWLVVLVDNPDPHALEGRLLQERAELGSWSAVSDRLGVVLRALGEEWSRGRITVLEEHMASERLERALARVCACQPSRPDAPRALLSTAEGDDHTFGLLLVELSLRELAWSTLFAGRATSTPMILEWLAKQPAVKLVALSASSTSKDRAKLAKQADEVGRACKKHGIQLVLGGAGAWPDSPRYGKRLFRVSELGALLE